MRAHFCITFHQHTGYWWRHATKHLSRAELREHSQDWIDLYGVEAYEASLVATEWVLELDFPPPPQPEDDADASERTRSGCSECGTELMQAAWGGPRLWRPQMIDACSLTQILGLYNQIQVRHAMPDRILALRPQR